MNTKSLKIAIIIICFLSVSSQAQKTNDPDNGREKNGVYTNDFFGFSYTYPKDWVVHGEATSKRVLELGKERSTQSGALSEAAAQVMRKHTYSLLTVFQYPLGTPGVWFDPSVMVVAEGVAHAPGIRSGRDYLLNVQPLMTKNGSESMGEGPIELVFSGAHFFRQDYRTQTNAGAAHQAMIVTVLKEHALAFIFTAQDEKGLDEQISTLGSFKFRVAPARITSRSRRKPVP
jgi:hypothetical protein